MSIQDRIMETQNDEKMLKCQYVARVYFNRAEIMNYISLVFAFASAFCIFLPESLSPYNMIIPIIIDIFVFLCCVLVARYTEWGAKLRNYFDAQVLGVQTEPYTQEAEREIWERVDIVCKNNVTECEIQIRNTGRDNPPGVKDWYEFSTKLEGNKAIYECQHINCWYNKKHRPYRFWISLCLALVVTLVIMSLLWIFNISLVESLICFFALVVKMFDRIYQNFRYINVSSRMDAIISLPGVEESRAQIDYLQTLINSRREIPVLEINSVHKRVVRKWSESYERIMRNVKR